jgi:predicted dehydrogenase
MSRVFSVALIGIGYWGPNYLRLVEQSNYFTLTAVCDKDPSRFGVSALKRSGAKRFDNFEDALAADTDVVIVSTPAATHYDICSRALQLGKHVLVEKPLTVSVSQAKSLFELAKQKGLVLMAGQVYLYNSAVQYIRHHLDHRRLLHLAATRTGLGPIRSDVNVVWDLAIHDFAIVNYLTGEQPTKVWAVGQNLLGQVEDTAVCFLKTGSSVASIRVSWLDPLKRREVSVVTPEDMVVFDDTNPAEPIKVYERGVRAEQVGPGADTFKYAVKNGPTTIPYIVYGEPLGAQLERFAERLRANQVPYTWEDQIAVRSVALAEAANHSMTNGGVAVRPADPTSTMEVATT